MEKNGSKKGAGKDLDFGDLGGFKELRFVQVRGTLKSGCVIYIYHCHISNVDIMYFRHTLVKFKIKLKASHKPE